MDILGQQSYNFVSRMWAVILSSSNNAPITATKQNAGGVAGWVSMGLVKDCANSGDVNADGALNVLDLMYLANFFAGKETTLG